MRQEHQSDGGRQDGPCHFRSVHLALPPLVIPMRPPAGLEIHVSARTAMLQLSDWNLAPALVISKKTSSWPA